MKITDKFKCEGNIDLKAHSIFKSLTYDDNADTWMLNFSNNISVLIATLWRVLKNNKILLVSTDHGHQFGLPKPVNIIEEISNELDGKVLSEITIKKDTSDLLLTFTDNLQIEIFISSAGYKSYNLQVDNNSYIGMGAGDLAIFSNQK